MVLGATAVGERQPRATHSQKNMHMHATCVAHLCIVCVSSPSDIKLELLFLGIIRAQTHCICRPDLLATTLTYNKT